MQNRLNGYRRLLCLKLIGVVALYCSTPFAQVSEDVEGSADISFIGRYPGSFISAAAFSDYDSYTFPKGLNTREAGDVFPKLELAGERTILIYDIPEHVENNVLKVFKSMERGFVNVGFETYINCSGEDGGCGSFMPRQVVSKLALEEYYRYRFKEFYNLNSGRVYLYSGHLEKEGDDYYLFAVFARSKYSSFIQYSLDLLKVASLETEKLLLTTGYMESEMDKNGKVVLSG